jgi:hypothetical protein
MADNLKVAVEYIACAIKKMILLHDSENCNVPYDFKKNCFELVFGPMPLECYVESLLFDLTPGLDIKAAETAIHMASTVVMLMDIVSRNSDGIIRCTPTSSFRLFAFSLVYYVKYWMDEYITDKNYCMALFDIPIDEFHMLEDSFLTTIKFYMPLSIIFTLDYLKERGISIFEEKEKMVVTEMPL